MLRLRMVAMLSGCSSRVLDWPRRRTPRRRRRRRIIPPRRRTRPRKKQTTTTTTTTTTSTDDGHRAGADAGDRQPAAAGDRRAAGAHRPQPAPVVIEERPVNVTVVHPRARRNVPLSLGGGLSNFTDQTLQDRTGMSGAYEARLGFGMSSLLGLEAAYVGTAGSIDTLGLDDEALLISNGVEGLARLNLGTYAIQPYVVGGASWVRYNVANDSFNTSDVRDSDSVLAIPFGGGISSLHR